MERDMELQQKTIRQERTTTRRGGDELLILCTWGERSVPYDK